MIRVPYTAGRAYGVAVIAVLGAAGGRWALFSEAGVAAPLATYCAAVMVAAWYGGWGPGLLATVLSIWAGLWFLPARYPSPPFDEQTAARIVVFVAVALLITGLNAAARRNKRRAAHENVARERVAGALAESESRFRIMADSAPVKVWMAPPDGLRDWFNARWLRFTGRTPMQEAGHGWLEGLCPDDRASWQAAWQAAFDRRAGFEAEYRLRRHDGEYRWLLDIGQPRFAADGSFAGYIGSAVDVTERRRQQDRLLVLAETSHVLAQAGLALDRVARAVVDRLAGSVGDLCVLRLLTPDGTMLHPVAFQHRDAGVTTLLATTLGDVPSGDGLLGHAVRSHEGVWRPRISAEELLAAAPRPELREYVDRMGVSSLLVSPLLASGRVLGTLALLRDRPGPPYTAEDRDLVTALASRAAAAVENAHLMRDEQAARAAAESANRLKDDFLATLSHELRTPLNAIVGWTELLRGGELDQRTTQRALETILRNARIQTELVNDVLDVSRIISGQFRIRLASVGLGAVVEAALDTVKPTAEAKAIALEVRIDPEAGFVAGDASRLQQVAWNLLSNALKFTPAGGRVEVRVASGHGRVDLVVSDTGAGIEPAFLPHVFERFRQADGSTTRAHGGLGLGLAIVRHIVELHGGTVEAESEGAGRGATFRVRLPAMAITPAIEPGPGSSPAAGEGSPPPARALRPGRRNRPGARLT
ncbi:MAG TPA: ATP-binding protein [Vicinamibacteria bacterium]|nr:ATP-binding protein [Vicinamibacteria bacterium]